VEWVRYGRPAAQALQKAISAAKAEEPLAPVSVVVSSNHVGVATRRLLASGALGPLCGAGAGVVAVSFLTVYRMAELLGAAALAGGGRRPVSTPVLAAALRRALAEDPGVFAPVAEHPATEMALVSAYKELRDVSLEGLDRLSIRSRRAADVVRLYHATRSRLVSQWYDEEDLINGAVELLDVEHAVLGDLGSVVVYLPQRLSRHGALLLRTVSRFCDVTVLAGTTGDERADAEVAHSVRRLVDTGSSSSPTDLYPMAVVSGERTRIVTTSDADEEVRAAMRAVIDAVRGGTGLDRIAILHASPEPYARLVHEQLSSAGVAHNGAAVVPLTARLAGRTLLGLLALPQGGFRREDVFAWLAGARVHHERRPVPVTAWERLSRDARVVGGREQWDRLLTTYAADCDAEAERTEADPDGPEWRGEMLRTNAARARALRDFALGLIDDLARAAASPRSWAERARWARGHLENLLGGERRRATWPIHEQKAAERVERALDRLGCLDVLEEAVELDVFARTLELELEADLGRVGRMGEGVLVGSVSMGIGLDLDLVVVLGLTEGSCPAPTRDDSLLPDHEREVIGDELTLRAEGIERQHREVLASLAGASRHLLCVPRGDLRRSTERIPSRWVLDIAGAVAGERLWSEDLLGGQRPWLEHVASFDAGLRRVDFPASEQDYRLRFLLAQDRARSSQSPAAVLGDRILVDGVEMVASRRSHAFTRYDGNLAGLHVPSPVDRPTSATRLEGWAVCPFAYLMHAVLGVEEVENPEDRLQISALDQGSLIHDVLEEFIDEVLTRPPAERPAPTEAWSESDSARMVAIAEAVCDRYEEHGLTGRQIFWQRDKRRIIADLERFLRADSDHRAVNGTRPVAAELAFGLPGAALGTVAMELPDGRSVHFRGKADRLDIATDGTAHVVDYKTGRPDAYADLSEDNPDSHGTKLQLPVYGLAARLHQGSTDLPVRAEYWFTSQRGGFKRIGYPVTPEVLEQVGRTLGQMVAGIENGVFPNYPTATSTTPWVDCPYCDPDALGVIDLRRRIEHKKADPALAVFLDLAEPPGGDEER
jgi:RecB family exonuclease